MAVQLPKPTVSQRGAANLVEPKREETRATRRDETRRDETRRDETRRGEARRGEARRGEASQGVHTSMGRIISAGRRKINKRNITSAAGSTELGSGHGIGWGKRDGNGSRKRC